MELSALAEVVEVTDDAEAATAELCARVEGLRVDDVGQIPYALIGTVDEIVETLRCCRARRGISSFVVRDHDRFAPVIDWLRGSRSPTLG